MLFGRPRLPMEAPMQAMAGAPAAPGMPGMPVAPAAPVVGPAGLVNMDIGGPELVAPAPGHYMEEHGMAHYPAQRIHVVLRGDTVWSLSRKYNVPMQAIIQANNLRYPDVLYPGERLVIPDGLHYTNY